MRSHRAFLIAPRVAIGGQALVLAHGILTLDFDGVGFMDDAIHNGVGQGGLPDFAMPAANVELGAEDGGGFSIAIFHQFQQIAGFRFLERI